MKPNKKKKIGCYEISPLPHSDQKENKKPADACT